MHNSIQNFRKVTLVWVCVMASLKALHHLGQIFPQTESLSVLMSATILMYTPFIVTKNSPQAFTYVSWPRHKIASDLLLFFGISCVVFLLYALGAHFYLTVFLHKKFQGWHGVGAGIYFLNQFVLTALPEEIFFRGYVEGECQKIKPVKTQVLGVPFGWIHVAISVLFALSHSLITFQWWHFSIVFPALLFSWLKQKTGTIWVSSLFHASCNFVAWFIFKAYF